MNRMQSNTSTKQTLQLYISCKNLPDKDVISKSDPFVEVFENGVKIGQTEQISDDLNPHFNTPIELFYQFERRQILRFKVKDDDFGGKSEHLGEIEIALGALVSSIEPGSPGLCKKLMDKRKKSTASEITINVVEVKSAGNQIVHLKCEGYKLDKMDWFGKSDPYFEIWCGKNAMVYRSEVIKSDLNPKWKVAEFSFARMEAFDSFDIKVFDWDNHGDNDFIGECTIHLNIDSNAPPSVPPNTKIALINKSKSNSKKSNSGTFILKSLKIVTQKTFFQYIQQAQVKLNFTCAIDFTGSNGCPALPSSLHYRNAQTMRNQYTDALAPIFMIVQDYDDDKIFPAYGFGAKLPNGQVSHHFPLNLDTGEPEMFDLPQILQHYWNCVSKVELWGPTNFGPTIKKVVDQATSAQRNFMNERTREYSVLLILTDGAITDMDETVKQIEKAQKLPISIIIVGVGNADFSSMELLDGDGGNNGFSNVRDCVQFCSYSEVENKFQGNMTDANVFNQIKETLAAEVLEELPKQLETYMKMNHPSI